MMNPTRKQLLRALEELSQTCPEYRFGQLIENLAFLAKPGEVDAARNAEDEELLAAARKHLEDFRKRHASVA